jgi:hypothetical protein
LSDDNARTDNGLREKEHADIGQRETNRKQQAYQGGRHDLEDFAGHSGNAGLACASPA